MSRSRTTLARIAGITLLAALAACAAKSPGPSDPGAKVCTQIGCIDGLRVNLTKPTPWAAGNYTFTFALDDAPVTCTGALPLPACDQGPALRCQGDDKAKRLVQIGESGCALPPEQHGFSDIQISGTPTKIQLTIEHAETVLHSSEFAPTYVTTRPNGPECGPECRSASTELALP